MILVLRLLTKRIFRSNTVIYSFFTSRVSDITVIAPEGSVGIYNPKKPGTTGTLDELMCRLLNTAIDKDDENDKKR